MQALTRKRLLSLVGAHVAVFGVSAAVAWSCQIDYPDTAFRCDPSTGACPDEFFCCSDDPTALDLDDLTAFVTPQYVNGEGDGTPLFSGMNNSLSRSGMCVKKGVVPPEAGLAELVGCPVPCNPSWSDDDIEEVCGGNALCCQTAELQSNDCVYDEGLDCVRPARGADALDGGVSPATNWSVTRHSTHQDPGPNASNGACRTFVNGAGGDDGMFNECVRRLTVADQRGFCLGIVPGFVEACPLDSMPTASACDIAAASSGLDVCN